MWLLLFCVQIFCPGGLFGEVERDGRGEEEEDLVLTGKGKGEAVSIDYDTDDDDGAGGGGAAAGGGGSDGDTDVLAEQRVCGLSYCAKCGNSAHPGDPICPPTADTLQWLGKHTKDCPNCHNKIEKNGGRSRREYTLRHAFGALRALLVLVIVLRLAHGCSSLLQVATT
jgi:hypothetical protein